MRYILIVLILLFSIASAQTPTRNDGEVIGACGNYGFVYIGKYTWVKQDKVTYITIRKNRLKNYDVHIGGVDLDMECPTERDAKDIMRCIVIKDFVEKKVEESK